MKERLPNNSFNANDPKELIDFPCSDVFLEHYHNLGMTPRNPYRHDTSVSELKQEVVELRALLVGVRKDKEELGELPPMVDEIKLPPRKQHQTDYIEKDGRYLKVKPQEGKKDELRPLEE